MKKSLKVKVLLALSAICVLNAQDMTAGTAAEQAGAVDQGYKVVDQLEEKAPEFAKENAASTEFVPANKQVEKQLKRTKTKLNYDKEKGTIIKIGYAEAVINDPANDKDFFRIRNAKAHEAYLNAKAEIIKTIYTDFSAMNRLSVVDNDGEDEIEAARKAKLKALQEKQLDLAKKFGQLDEAEAAALAGVTLPDRLGAVLDGLNKKLDSTYSTDKIKADKRALRDELKAECEALKSEFDVLEEDCKSIPQPTTQLESNVSLMSKMPLLGSSVVCQAESWDETGDKVYCIAMAVVWSPQLQEDAFALAHNNNIVGKKGKYTAEEWIERQDLSSMVGPRRFRDNEGRTIFVGISAIDLSGPVSKRNVKRKKADTEAWTFVAFSLLGDIEAYREAKTNFKEYDDSTRKSEEKFSDVIMQKCNMVIQGCTSLDAREVVHPISKQKMYVVAYYIDPDLAKQSGDLMKKAYAAANVFDKAMQRKRGIHDGMEQELKQQRESKTEYNRGKAEGSQAVKKEVNNIENNLEQNRRKAPVSTGARGSKNDNGPRTSQGGTFTGDSEIDTDF